MAVFAQLERDTMIERHRAAPTWPHRSRSHSPCQSEDGVVLGILEGKARIFPCKRLRAQSA
ncbi:MAG TPA: hypothetical protein VMT56_04230, partial [Candidatus Bathyarchaeia archaeon]|nr:hypothetical protein [Candidatus Bathyarchaeia archaeon]